MTPSTNPAAGAVRDTAIAICERWLAAFADTEIKYTSARQYAVVAVRDIIDQIRAIDIAAAPAPASGVDAVAAEREACRCIANAMGYSPVSDGVTIKNETQAAFYMAAKIAKAIETRASLATEKEG